jgi:tetratricopeptide (TPR) repeat protein
MIRECKCCGAPADQEGLQAWWECKFCQSVNYDERVVEAYLANTDIAKLSNQIRIGRSYYEAGDFEKAIDHFDRALMEDARHAEAWAYKGLALAYTVDLQNISNVLRGVEQCFKQARSATGQGDELVDAAHGVARERVVAELLRCAVRETEHAEKSIFAFSGDPGRAQFHAGEQYASALSALAACLSAPSTNVRQMADVCRLAVAISREKYAPPAESVAGAAQRYLDEIRTKHPSISVDIPKSRNVEPDRGCFG